ncbi:hypothetical protein DPX16_14133 [Anabarilius grahami]|uniref:Uncharacterized protein n=1 Tax=Anabarilius grahami TaxID=495550 RepID=A0A3N0Z3N4_ANAGA|nr:hypothetical protein DPX16_14133 [Anabarilius grahami]
MERLGRKCCMAWDDFCAAVKRSVNPSTAGPKRPAGEKVEKGHFVDLLDLRQIEPEVRSSMTRLAMDRPMAWAVAFVARRAKSVALWRSRKAGSASQGGGSSAGLSRKGSFILSPHSRGGAEMSGHGLVQGQHLLISLLLRAIN